jgi:hypothetical protein
MKYKLLKDMPDLPSGAIFEQKCIASVSGKDERWFVATRNGGDGKWVYSFDREALERNQDWFEHL